MIGLKLRANNPNILDPNEIDSECRNILDKVVNVIDSTGIDTEQAVLVGSAAIACYGVKLSDLNGETRPSDIDLAVTCKLYSQLFNTSQTPNGMLVEKKKVVGGSRTNILTTNSELPIDFINSMPSYGNPLRHDQRFVNSPYNLVGDTGIKVATPKIILQELRRNSLDPKYKSDLRIFINHKSSLKQL